MPNKIFISCDDKSNSKFIINSTIYKKLVTNGYLVLNEFNDKNNNNKAKIDEQIEECDFFVWAVCNEYLSSDFHIKQLKKARSLNKKIIQLLVSANVDLSLLPDDLDGILDKQELVEMPNNLNVYFEIINTIGTIGNSSEKVSDEDICFALIKRINFEKTFELEDFKNMKKIFDANENEIIGVESYPFCVHVFSKETLEFKQTIIKTKDLFTVTDICKLNGYNDNLLIIGSDNDSNSSYMYLINNKTFEIITRKHFKETFDAKGITTTKAKKKFFNSCCENMKKSCIYVLESFLKATILVFNYELELVDECSVEIPVDYSNIFMRKLATINNGEFILMTNAINNCIHMFDTDTFTHKNAFAGTLNMNARAIYSDKYGSLLTLSWNNPCNGFNVFNTNGNHIASFNLPFKNTENRLFHPASAIFLNANQMLVLDGNYTNLLHLYSIEYA